MQLQAGMRWVQLEIKGCRFHSLLLLASELREAVGKRVRYSKFHDLTQRVSEFHCHDQIRAARPTLHHFVNSRLKPSNPK
jgi:hypothetical protein